MASQDETAESRAAVLTWATVFDKKQWSTGGIEVVITLVNISEAAEHIDEPTATVLRASLRGSGILKDKEIMSDVKAARKGFPKDHWWWWPEKL